MLNTLLEFFIMVGTFIIMFVIISTILTIIWVGLKKSKGIKTNVSLSDIANQGFVITMFITISIFGSALLLWFLNEIINL